MNVDPGALGMLSPDLGRPQWAASSFFHLHHPAEGAVNTLSVGLSKTSGVQVTETSPPVSSQHADATLKVTAE